MLKKRLPIILLVIFSLVSWGIWIIETNPFFTNTWEWTRELKITFILVPLLFMAWGFMSEIISKKYIALVDLFIFAIFFSVILLLIIISHAEGPAALIFLPFVFLLYKPVSLILISFLTLGFNLLVMKASKFEINRRDFFTTYISFYSVPVVMFLVSLLFKLFNANEHIIGFYGFNNMDSILWFKSGIIIPITFIYEGLLLLVKSPNRRKGSEMKNPGPIYLYTNSELKKYESFIEKEYGDFDEVLHEIVSPDIHLDIAIVPPTDGQPYYKLITMGAGAYKMNVPRELKSYKLEHAEYAIFLPKEWDIKSDREEYYWAVRQLKNIARLPIETDSWLAYGHTVTANEDFSPVASNTGFNSFVLINSINKNNRTVPPLKLGLTKKINFYQVFPLYNEEVNYKIENSLEKLIARFSDKDFDPVVNINRKNNCL